MKKNKIKYFIFLFMGILLLPSNVYALNALAGTTTRREDAKVNPGIIYDGQHLHKSYSIKVRYNGQEYKGYCENYGQRLVGYPSEPNRVANNYFCQSVHDPGLLYILNSGKNDDIITAAVRRYKDYHTVSGDLASEINQLVDAARNVKNESEQLVFIKENFRETNNTYEATYKVSSSTNISNINFICNSSNGCDVIEQNWNGTSGSVKVRVKEPDCNFTISAVTSGNNNQNSNTNLFECVAQGQQTITFSFSGDSSSNSSTEGGINGTIIGSVEGATTGGNYYKKYCDKNGESKCNQETVLKMPTYCDEGENEASIKVTNPDNPDNLEEETNVKYCILNDALGNEEGVSYKMTDGQVVDNPYCAVYCKEDYNMTLPGSQFTTSGRYFTLQDTTIKATRTCYTTNPDSDPEKTNIKIGGDNDTVNKSGFIEDVINAQKAMLSAANDYEKAKKELELSKNPTITKTSHCDTSKADEEFKSIASSSYSAYTIDDSICDKKTGVCQANKTATKMTTERTWGLKITTTSCGKCSDGSSPTGGICSTGSCQCTETEDRGNYTEEQFEQAVIEAKAKMQKAASNLNDIIKKFKECFNWSNKLCLDPILDFAYEEPYNIELEYNIPAPNNDKEVTYSKNTEMNEYYTSGMQEGNLETITYLFCDESGCRLETKAENISTEYFHVKKVSEGIATIKNKTQFQSNFPHGTIEEKPPGSGEPQSPYEYLGAVFPIALKTPTGVYKWSFKFSNMGQYNDSSEPSCKLGRLNEILEKKNKGIETDLEYVCVYVVDCPDCEYSCECPPESLLPDQTTCEKRGQYECVIIEPDCPECKVYCINCVFDGEDTYFYRTVSLNDFNPNNRELGINWNEKASQKASETFKKITEDLPENAYQNAEYTFTITPTNMKNIRDYNKNTGTYVAQDLTYESVDGITNIAGYSSFLRDMGQSNRPINKNYFSAGTLNNNWKLWTGEQVQANPATGVVNVELLKASVGPAWK